jgi:hypothetical protein
VIAEKQEKREVQYNNKLLNYRDIVNTRKLLILREILLRLLPESCKRGKSGDIPEKTASRKGTVSIN